MAQSKTISSPSQPLVAYSNVEVTDGFIYENERWIKCGSDPNAKALNLDTGDFETILDTEQVGYPTGMTITFSQELNE